jgi:hypothetical protein
MFGLSGSKKLYVNRKDAVLHWFTGGTYMAESPEARSGVDKQWETIVSKRVLVLEEGIQTEILLLNIRKSWDM